MNVYELIGSSYSVDALINQLLRDKTFYDTSCGGVTFSGGEPLLHSGFLNEVSCKLHQYGIHAAVETAGNVGEKTINEAIKYIDLFLYDIKMLDPVKHKKYTGETNERILKNIVKISESGGPIIARLLIIPGFNDGNDAIKRIDFARSLNSIVQVDLLKYHQLGQSKYTQLGIKFDMDPIDLDDELLNKEMMRLAKYSKSLGLKTTIGG